MLPRSWWKSWARFGALDMYFKKRFCHHSTGKESVTLGNMCRQGFWAPINQYPTCAFCVENDFESTITSPSSALTSPREFCSCKLCGKDFSIDSWLKMHIISKYQTNSQAPNQCTIPLSLHLPRCLLRENSVPASCVVKIFQSTHG